MKQKSYKFLNILWVIWEIHPIGGLQTSEVRAKMIQERETNKHLRGTVMSQTLALHRASFISSKNSQIQQLCFALGILNTSHIRALLLLVFEYGGGKHRKQENKTVTDRINAIKKRKVRPMI